MKSKTLYSFSLTLHSFPLIVIFPFQFSIPWLQKLRLKSSFLDYLQSFNFFIFLDHFTFLKLWTKSNNLGRFLRLVYLFFQQISQAIDMWYSFQSYTVSVVHPVLLEHEINGLLGFNLD